MPKIVAKRVEKRVAKWNEETIGGYTCSNCSIWLKIPDIEFTFFRFCPYCGTKMDKE